MIKVYVKKKGKFPVDTPKLKEKIKIFLTERGIVSDAELTILIAGKKLATSIAKKHLGDAKAHNVLSFPASEATASFNYPPDSVIHLGEIVVCYPEVIKESKDQGVRIDDKVYELAEHGARHLLGEHHE